MLLKGVVTEDAGADPDGFVENGRRIFSGVRVCTDDAGTILLPFAEGPAVCVLIGLMEDAGLGGKLEFVGAGVGRVEVGAKGIEGFGEETFFSEEAVAAARDVLPDPDRLPLPAGALLPGADFALPPSSWPVDRFESETPSRRPVLGRFSPAVDNLPDGPPFTVISTGIVIHLANGV